MCPCQCRYHLQRDLLELKRGQCVLLITAKINSIRKSSLLQRKSFNNVTSTLLVPTHPYLSLAGFENVLEMISKGCSKKVLPQLAGPTMNFASSFTQKGTNPVSKHIWVNTVAHQYLVGICQPLTFTNTVIFLVDFFYQGHPAHISSLNFFRSSL